MEKYSKLYFVTISSTCAFLLSIQSLSAKFHSNRRWLLTLQKIAVSTIHAKQKIALSTIQHDPCKNKEYFVHLRQHCSNLVIPLEKKGLFQSRKVGFLSRQTFLHIRKQVIVRGNQIWRERIMANKNDVGSIGSKMMHNIDIQKQYFNSVPPRCKRYLNVCSCSKGSEKLSSSFCQYEKKLDTVLHT